MVQRGYACRTTRKDESMNLTKGGVQGVLSAVKVAAEALEKVQANDNRDDFSRSDEQRGYVVTEIIASMNRTIDQRIRDDQLPGDPTKAEAPPATPGGPPPPPPA